MGKTSSIASHYIRQLRRPKRDKLFSFFEYFFDAAGDFDRFLLGYPASIQTEPLFPVVPRDTDVVIRFIFRMLGLNHDSGLPVDVHILDDRAFNTADLCGIGTGFTKADYLHTGFRRVLNTRTSTRITLPRHLKTLRQVRREVLARLVRRHVKRGALVFHQIHLHDALLPVDADEQLHHR